ncbi:kinesin [Novymonas esmeraldas]|uniref:Kinesin n=1 Tax=Novymonas esmeraldas TaxID=1808958 RepID=A0AAW0EMK6_9TRYP
MDSGSAAVAPASASYPDDGHIFVCVRVRDVPQSTASVTGGNTPATANTRASTVARKSLVREAQRICVSVVENVVVMHDPKSIEDDATVAKDGNNVVQMLTDRATRSGAARPSRKMAAAGVAGAAPRTGSRRTVGGRVTTDAGTGAARLVSTGTANYYECDHCIASMEESQLLQMPLIRTSDFLQPPPYGTQEEVYRRTAMHAVSAAVDGINSCVFAYGQTGSGKTYTLFGDTSNIRRDPGVVPRTLDDLFSRLEAVRLAHHRDVAGTDYSYTVQLSFYEIYQNEVYCLLSRQGPLHVQFVRDAVGARETMIIHDLQQQTVSSAEKAYLLVEMGLRRRQTAETGMNARSSRSHAILQVRVMQYRTNRSTRETVEHQATINLVDLAGSERQKTANTNGTHRAEGIQINQSLATLARVINDISSGAKFVNYRDSLLTMVLKDNLGGNSKTFMIANISPVAFSYQESCATLTYARDVRKIRNRPMVNKTFQTRANLLEQNTLLKQKNEKLKEQMEAWMRGLQSHGEDLHPAGAATDTLDVSPARGRPLRWSPPPPVSSLAVAGELRRAANASLAAATGSTDVFVSASCGGRDGRIAPLLLSSHRQYTSLAGIGGSCIDNGIVRVSALLKERMEFPLRQVLSPLPAEGGDVKAPPPPDGLAAAAADLGSLVVERVAQRSCELRYYVHFSPPASAGDDAAAAAGAARLIDVQVNGKSIGAKGRRVLHHGDVVCAYVDGALAGAATSAADTQAHHLVLFHYVDLNAVSRDPGASAHGLGSGATLGQIAVSVDLPQEVEGLTLDGIKQLQRDNAKLLDMVRQQAETIEYQCARASASVMQAENLLEGISPLDSPGSVSPNPRSLERSVSASTPPPPAKTRYVAVTMEAFRRLSVSPSIRGGSTMPADMEADELLRRAAAQSESQQRLDSAIRENVQLHRTAVTRNATMEALARRLAELEAGGPLDPPPASSHASSSSPSSSSVSLSPSAARSDTGAVLAGVHVLSQGDEDAEGDHDDVSTRTASARGASSASSHSRAASASSPRHRSVSGAAAAAAAAATASSSLSAPAAAAAGAAPSSSPSAGNDDDTTEAPLIDSIDRRIVHETTEATRVRYQAVIREREQFDRILELEALVQELREQISELESRLRFSKDDTLEQQMLREQAESERDALLQELQDARVENAGLRREMASLESFLASDEQALADAARLADEEVARQTAVLADRVTALKALARLWKQRTMKYIAMSYGAGGGGEGAGANLDAIPWDDLRAAETVAIAKRRLGGGDADACPAEMAQTVDDFEKATAEENLRALEYALLRFERENQRLLDEMRSLQAELDGYRQHVDRLRTEKSQTEAALAKATGATEEERRRMQQLLCNTNAQLDEAEKNLKETQRRLDDTMALCDSNKRRAVRNNELLLAQQKRTIEELEATLDRVRRDCAAKDEELSSLARYVEDRDTLGGDGGAARTCELRTRIEELVTDSIEEGEAPSGYSMFPAGFEFSDEMVALIRVCLRILLDRLKMELYVLNAQSVHKFQLLIHAVKARTEAHFHTFMHQLRDAVSQMTGRTVRPGGKWGLSEADVLSALVDHRRRQVGDALNGLLIWYDHWDNAPKTEHVAYMELIRNADRIMQMARLVRRESQLNTNATSTMLMPIPGKNGASDTSLISEAARRQDTTVRGGSKVLTRLVSSTRQSNLGRALHQFSATPSRATVAGRDDAAAGTAAGAAEEGATPFSRSATVTALALSQSMLPFSRSATGTRGSGHHGPPPSASTAAGAAGSAHPESCPPFTRCPSGLPRPSTTTVPVASLTQPPATSTATPMRPTKAAAATTTPATAAPAAAASVSSATAAPAAAAAASASRAHYSRMASTGVLPVSEADVAYVANTDVAEAVSISSYNFSRRMSSAAVPVAAGADAHESVRRPGRLFSRCQTAIPLSSAALQQRQHRVLQRQASATPTPTKAHTPTAVVSSRSPVSRAAPAESFARSKTHYGAPARRSGHGSGPRRSTGSSVRSSCSLSTGVSPHAPRLSAFYGTPTTAPARASGNDRTATPGDGAAPASFYHPAVMGSLRERSTSEVNRAAPHRDKSGAVMKRAGLAGGSAHSPKKKSTAPLKKA